MFQICDLYHVYHYVFFTYNMFINSNKKISESAQFCPNCGFSFKKEDLEIYKQKLEERRQQNAEINRKSTKLHLIWFAIFTIVILLASWLTGE